MSPGLEFFFDDPIIQLLIFVIGALCIFDTLKLVLLWVWKILGGKEEQ
jgi:hypothetical protein